MGKGEVAARKMGERASAALSLPRPRAFFAFLFTERLFNTISEPGTGYMVLGFLTKKFLVPPIYIADHHPTLALFEVPGPRR